MIKKLIEVALPLDDINKEAIHEKNVNQGGHPSTLHLWWARRPLAAARAVIWASLVDAPSSHPEKFPTVEEQDAERNRLFGILKELILWKNSNNEQVLKAAREEILKSTNGALPVFLDPFAGGGAIPLEAQRLGLEAHAFDLNPVAVMINKAMIEIPPLFEGNPPVNPDAREKLGYGSSYRGTEGLKEDVCYYGDWIKSEAEKTIGNLYPKVVVPSDSDVALNGIVEAGKELTVSTWVWARTIKCPNPVCGCEMPLVRSFILSKDDNLTVWYEPIFKEGETTYKVHYGGMPSLNGTVNKNSGARCACCGSPVSFDHIREEGQNDRIGSHLVAIIAEGEKKRVFLSPDINHITIATIGKPDNIPTTRLPEKALGFRVQAYGMVKHADLFTNRQLTALKTFVDLVEKVQNKVVHDAVLSGMPDDQIDLKDGGSGATAYGQAIGVYMAFLVDKLADYNSSICSWHNSKRLIRNTFSLQTVKMVWDYTESNPFCNSSGCFSNMLKWITDCISRFPSSPNGYAEQNPAQKDNGLRNVLISTDPPYYDNIGYSDLSDFFYVWLRRLLKKVFPQLFRTMLVPKEDELVATPFRFGGKNNAKTVFMDGMLEACRRLYQYSSEDFPVTIYYAYKQKSSKEDSEQAGTSAGWEAILTAIIKAGFTITGTWPMRTEMQNRPVSNGTNALASSIVLVCRKRPINAPVTTKRQFLNELRKDFKPALEKLQKSNIAPVDLAQSAIGPGMAVYSRYSNVLESDGSSMTVRTALTIINQELDHFLNKHEGNIDAETRVCIELFTMKGFGEIDFGSADTLARAKNTSVAALSKIGVAVAEKGIVRLKELSEFDTKTKGIVSCLWYLVQLLTRTLQTGGVEACAQIVHKSDDMLVERAKELAYRLYTIAEQNGRAQDAFFYNALVVAWPEIQSKVAELESLTITQQSIDFDQHED